MLLETAHRRLGWPAPQTVLEPTGAGTQVYLQLAREKLGAALSRLENVGQVQIGVLTSNATSQATDAPLAIVCEFTRSVSKQTLEEAHKLAWNFCRAPLLLIIEPNLIRAWTCCEPPLEPGSGATSNPEVDHCILDPNATTISEHVAESLHWINLVSGQFFRKHEGRFHRSNCADEWLLRNLEFVRDELHHKGRLDYDTIHDLLARIIFVQFLFQRKDSTGKAALDAGFLSRLHDDGVLSEKYFDLAGVLSSHADTYALFKQLNSRFNGDLFPGKGKTKKEKQAQWQTEMQKVDKKHLDLLADFISGNMKMRRGERNLWPLYSFDVIPLEFISSVYEAFVGEEARQTGAHYTPSHIVDFILDEVLPWDSDEWDLKILDPACGSGIFLVKAYQRLIHRWKKANPGKQPDAGLLRQILEKNLFGVDTNPHAVRVASFSLYLAMCDEIDPRHYWQRVKFPELREKRLIKSDFFNDKVKGFRTYQEKETYDLVVGNAPWGKNTARRDAKLWMRRHPDWKLSYGSVGPLFLPKAAWLTKRDGRVAMLQPAGLLFNSSVAAARDFRKVLFTTYCVEEVVNLSALRFGLFHEAIAPACIVILSPTPPEGGPVSYKCPKPLVSFEDDFRIVLEPHDVNEVHLIEAAADPFIWTTLMWGGRRDLRLVRSLTQRSSIGAMEADGVVIKRQGLNHGNRGRTDSEIHNRRILDTEQFPAGTMLYVQAKHLPMTTKEDAKVDADASTDYAAFQFPQLIIKQGWQMDAGRFQAAMVDANGKSDSGKGILCSKSYVSVTSSRREVLEAACLSYNSRVAVYHLLLTSGRLASYRPEANVDDIIRVPIPEPVAGILDGLTSIEDIDRKALEAFDLKRSEKVLISDLIDYTLADFKGDASSPGRQSTRGAENGEETGVTAAYCDELITILKAGFGANKPISATIFEEQTCVLPIRLIALHLNWPGREPVKIERMDAPDLMVRLNGLNQLFLEKTAACAGGIYHQRVARIYSSFPFGDSKIPSVYIVKPDRIRYWTRSAAQRDADAVAADAMIAVKEPIHEIRVGATA